MTSTTTPPEALPNFDFFLAFPGPETMKFGVNGHKYGGKLETKWKEYISHDDDLDPKAAFFRKKE